VFAEMLAMNNGGKTYPFELRFRTREEREWSVNVFRPFPKAETLAKRIEEIRPDWQDSKNLRALMASLRGSFNFPSQRFHDAAGGNAFVAVAKVHALPAINDDDLVAELLITTRWSSALGESWKPDNQKGFVEAPTTNRGAGFHIVPENYAAHAVSVDRQSCMNCHQHTNRAVSSFQSGRTWFGRVRGSDGIISMHPIAKSAISTNGRRVRVGFNQAMVNARIVEAYAANKHPKSMYRKQDPAVYREGNLPRAR